MRGSYQLAGSEHRTSAAAARDGHRPKPDAAYLSLPPADQMADIRAEITSVLATLGVPGLKQAHGRASGQNEICGVAGGLAAGGRPDPADEIRDPPGGRLLRQVATFMPKPVADEPGSGMSVHQALWRDGKPTFAGQGYADLSALCLQFVAGVMLHARALNAFTNPTTNSYKRLRPGQDEPPCWRTPRTTARPRSASPMRRDPMTSGSRFASPTRPPTPISPSPRS